MTRHGSVLFSQSLLFGLFLILELEGSSHSISKPGIIKEEENNKTSLDLTVHTNSTKDDICRSFDRETQYKCKKDKKIGEHHKLNQDIATEVKDMTSGKNYTGGLDVDEQKNITNLNSTVLSQKIVEERHTNNTNASIGSTTPKSTNIPENKTTTLKPQPSNPTHSAQYQSTTDPDNKIIDETKHDRLAVPHNSKLGTTKSAALAAGIGLTVALMAYVSLIVWRKVLVNQYGNSEMLLNEDDVGEMQDEDMKYFELKLMDKDGNVVET